MNPNEASVTVPFAKVVGALIYLLLLPVMLFLLAGDWRWIEGWVFSVTFYLLCGTTLIYLYFKDPALLKERFGSPVQEGQKAWDKVVLSLFVFEFLVWFAIMPLDARRFGWSPTFPFQVKMVGAVLLLLSLIVLFEALHENTFAAPVVKIQRERGQKVISTGLYAIVRHPMYSGATLLFVAAPLLLSSVYGLALGFILIVTIALRSVGEEAMLRQELEGYGDYMKKVKWRLIPFVF
jgi:protein-S-isoprenylcysteine O-methyltransferase Ste14